MKQVSETVAASGWDVTVAVCGQHMHGGRLHYQLEDLHAEYLRKARTAASYRLFALPTDPVKPGLLRDGGATAALDSEGPLCGFFAARPNSVVVELYGMSFEAFGRLVSMVPAPLGFGTVELEDGSEVKGFLVEAAAVFCERGLRAGVADITAEGTFAGYLG